jgi:hypothetical protein
MSTWINYLEMVRACAVIFQHHHRIMNFYRQDSPGMARARTFLECALALYKVHRRKYPPKRPRQWLA